MERKYQRMHILFEESGSCLTINLATSQAENWLFDSQVYTNYKTSDRCLIKFETAEGELISYEGYVPSFFPGNHFGDYVMLSISRKGMVQGLEVTDAEIDQILD
jgi:hypothetical protein